MEADAVANDEFPGRQGDPLAAAEHADIFIKKLQKTVRRAFGAQLLREAERAAEKQHRKNQTARRHAAAVSVDGDKFRQQRNGGENKKHKTERIGERANEAARKPVRAGTARRVGAERVAAGLSALVVIAFRRYAERRKKSVCARADGFSGAAAGCVRVVHDGPSLEVGFGAWPCLLSYHILTLPSLAFPLLFKKA